MKQKSMIALYSIKPVYTDRIISGDKIFELRKRLPAKKLDYIVIYSSSPICKIVGYAEILGVHKNKVSSIWKLVSSSAGIAKKDYMEYFKGCDDAYAFELGKVIRFIRPFELNILKPGLVAPQSFSYVDDCDFKRIIKRKTESV